MGKIAALAIGILIMLWVSRASMRDYHSHGFYRLFAWVFIWIAFLVNVDFWFVNPLSLTQILAWLLLIGSLILIIAGVRAFQQEGDIDPQRPDQGLVGIEKTTRLVTTGIYGYIRHPFYSSLLFLCWGILFKNISGLSLLLCLTATMFLVITARVEEQENVNYFGESYTAYMSYTKMFIPYVI